MKDIDEYKSRFADDSAPGWDALTDRLRAVYGEQEPRHWGTLISHRLGGPDPLDGISAYDCGDGGTPHLHFVTFGYSNLYYDEEAAGGEYSGYGFEMTFRLAPPPAAPEEPMWAAVLLQKLARYVFSSGRCFEAGHWAATGPIRADEPTDVVGLAFLADPTLAPVETPHGRVEFVQAFGITAGELERLKGKEATAEEILAAHRRANPLLVTDLGRKG